MVGCECQLTKSEDGKSLYLNNSTLRFIGKEAGKNPDGMLQLVLPYYSEGNVRLDIPLKGIDAPTRRNKPASAGFLLRENQTRH